MKIGEVVEVLIRLRDVFDLSRYEDEAVCVACNVLDRLPIMMDEEQAKNALNKAFSGVSDD